MQYLSTDALARMLDMTPEHVRDKLSKSHGFPAAICVHSQTVFFGTLDAFPVLQPAH